MATAPANSSPNRLTTPRLGSVDLLRGIVMVVMALDHVRDYFSDARFEPTDLDHTTVPLFLTRWITHFCAPVFVLLAGTGAFLSKKPKPELARFLVTRGLWLVVLELTFVRFGWTFELVGELPLQVIWAIGCSMVCLAPLVFVRPAVAAAFGVAMIALHNATDAVRPEAFGAAAWLWKILHAGGPLAGPFGLRAYAAYPLVPWIGVMAVGYALGALLTREPAARDRALLAIGVAVTALFVALRALDVYGDPSPLEHRSSPVLTALSFLNCTKYPPSLLYLCMTLGPSIALLVPLERARGRLADIVTTFGRVPLFYYLLHVPLIHLAAAIVARARFGPGATIVPSWMQPPPVGWGYGLLGVYAIWATVIVLLFPACRWFAGVKRRRRDAWLSYL